MARRYKTIGGIQYARAADIKPSAADRELSKTPIGRAIRKQWPTSNPEYWRLIERQFSELYLNLPEAEALQAIEAGFSSPAAAMFMHLIPRRRYVGFCKRKESNA